MARHDMFAFNWAVAADDHPSPCTFTVTLVPGNGAEPIVAVETSTTNVAQGPLTGPDSGLDWPLTGGAVDSFTVSITSGCTWTMGLQPLPHD
jgi:hypothetical protein